MVHEPRTTNKPAIAQLLEHLTVECCSNQMVPGSIPGGRIDPAWAEAQRLMSGNVNMEAALGLVSIRFSAPGAATTNRHFLFHVLGM